MRMTVPKTGWPGRAAATAALLAVFAGTWIALDRTEHRPGWLAVEAPAVAVVGQRLEIRVTLKRSVEAAWIDCTLHRANAERRGWGYLASSGPAREAVGGRTYSFVFTVPEREETAIAFALVYLSPTGRWQDGTRAVTTRYMPVSRARAAPADLVLRKTRTYRYPTAAEAAASAAKQGERRPRGRPAVWIHPALAVILLAAAALCLAKAGRKDPGGRPAGERTLWLVFAAALALGAVMELSGLAGHVAAWGRRLAEETNIYESRKPFQKALMAAVAAASLGIFLLFVREVRKPGPHRSVWWAGLGLAAYLAVSFVSVLSFHAVDVARGMLWHGVSPVDAARGAAALVTLLAAALAPARASGAGTI
jgi:hypothetical protein